MSGRSNSTNTNTNKFNTGDATQKFTKSKYTNTKTKNVVTVDIQTTTELNLMDIHSTFIIRPSVKIIKSACKDGLTRTANGDCVFKFADA